MGVSYSLVMFDDVEFVHPFGYWVLFPKEQDIFYCFFWILLVQLTHSLLHSNLSHFST